MNRYPNGKARVRFEELEGRREPPIVKDLLVPLCPFPRYVQG